MGAKTKDKPVEAVPPPTALFGGWTGKAPVTLLNEYVQRQQAEGWHRADYNIQGTAHTGFTCVIRLSKQDKKLGRLKVEFRPTATATTPLRHPTALEARHMAATYALHRLRANTSLYRMIPPVCRAYWLELDANRGEPWMYDDPFAAKLARDRERDDREKERAKKEEIRSRALENGRLEDLLPPALRSRWDALAQVDMSEALRNKAESVVRTWTDTWGITAEEEGSRDSGEGLAKMGFRSAHIDEALKACGGDSQAALQWLCVYVPEDDLPEHIMQRGYQSSMVTGSNAASNVELSRELAAKRLARSGFSLSQCRAALDSAPGDLGAAESRAMDILVSSLCRRPVPGDGLGDGSVDEEVEALDAIYAGENRVTRQSPLHVTVGVRPRDQKQCPRDACLEFWVPADGTYPELRPPSVTLSSDAMPAFLKLHIARMIDHRMARDGMPVLFDVVSMVDDSIEEWLERPPLLAELMSGIAPPIDNLAPALKFSPKPANRDRRPGPWSAAVRAFADAQKNEAYQMMQQGRALLPAARVAVELVALIRSHRCVVVSGATGCGKTTQVPQFILDDGLQTNTPTSIVCTQPRRISALGVAARVAEERASAVGEVVGYAVRGESRRSAHTRLLFCTTGVLLRMLSGDPSLADTTHVICDEVHERSVDSDLLLVLLLQSLKLNPHLRVVLMSATAQSDLFAGYFGFPCPIVDIPGRTFPVDDVYVEDFIGDASDSLLAEAFGAKWRDAAQRRWDAAMARDDSEPWIARARALSARSDVGSALAAWEDRHASPFHIDFDLVACIVRHIHVTKPHSQSILIFMPGVAEITATMARLGAVGGGLLVLPLHSGLLAADQRRVFRAAAKGERKVVVATNIAETSITIDDVGFVIDAGRVRELRHDHGACVARLTTVLCSRAAADQRRGRAGRTQRGVCYRLYTRRLFENMPAHGDPEILRSPLEQVCLRVKALGYGDPRVLLESALDPPPMAAVTASERLLVAVGASTGEFGALTALGRFIADIPVDLRLAKILVYGALVGALEDALMVVALMALDKPMYVGDREQVRQARMQFSNDSHRSGLSDWLADLAALKHVMLTAVGKKACLDLCVSPAAIREIKSSVRQLRDSLKATGLVESAGVAPGPMVLKALVCAGLVPNIVRVRMPKQKFTELINGSISKDPEARQVAFYAPDVMASGKWQSHNYHGDRRVFVHPQSTLFSVTKYQASPFIVYFAQQSSSSGGGGDRVYLRDATVPGLYALLMFGPGLTIDHGNKVVSIGDSGSLALRAWPRIAVLVSQLRVLLDELLRRKLESPGSVTLADHPVVKVVLELIETDGR
ncbi:helicase [Coemansia sp. BCRC 34962]|nr:helicase [Coemansia sp. BCRC 34962]